MTVWHDSAVWHDTEVWGVDSNAVTITYTPAPGTTPLSLSIASTPPVTVQAALVAGLWTFTFTPPPDGRYARQVMVNGPYGYTDNGYVTFLGGQVVTASARSLVSYEELHDRLGSLPDVPSAAQLGRLRSVLDRASSKVRSYGSPSWTATTAPDLARDIALDVAERTWNNPRSDLTSQSTGSVSESYVVGSADLTTSEINDLRRLGGRRSIGSIRLQPELRTSVLTSRRWGYEDWPC